MPLYEEFDRYYAGSQRGQKLALRDRSETIQSKLPVPRGEVILTQTRLYLATGDGPHVPNVRLTRSRPRAYPEERYLEIASRMGAELAPGQTAAQFLQIVEHWRNLALERAGRASSASRDGVRRRREAVLERARSWGAAGERRKMKETLRNLHAADPGRREAAARLGEAYLEEGNHRAAAIWLGRARAFDSRLDRALARVESPRLPSREWPPPEWWIDRHLTPLLELPEGEGPGDEQRRRIRAARERIAAFRAASGRATPAAWGMFVVAVAGWVVLLFLSPWPTLGVTAAAAVALGTVQTLRSRGRRPARR